MQLCKHTNALLQSSIFVLEIAAHIQQCVVEYLGLGYRRQLRRLAQLRQHVIAGVRRLGLGQARGAFITLVQLNVELVQQVLADFRVQYRRSGGRTQEMLHIHDGLLDFAQQSYIHNKKNYSATVKKRSCVRLTCHDWISRYS
jgi:hypothetical protein